MAWIESHETLRHHPKTRKLARRLGVHPAQAVGHLHFLWWWCLSYAQDGELGAYDAEQIADAAGWDGDADEFLSAMREAGFIDETTVHDWWDYAGKLVDRRERNRQNMRKARETTRRESGPSVADTCTPRDDTCKATVPNPTVPNPTQPTVPTTPTVPTGADGGSIGGVVSLWLNNIGDLPPVALERLTAYVEDDGMEPALLDWAIRQGIDAGARNLKYIGTILDNCRTAGIKTRREAEARSSKHKQPTQPQDKPDKADEDAAMRKWMRENLPKLGVQQ